MRKYTIMTISEILISKISQYMLVVIMKRMIYYRKNQTNTYICLFRYKKKFAY